MKPQFGDPKHARKYFADKMTFTTGPAELKHWLDEKEPVNVIDVRRAEDYEKGHIPGAVSLPKEKWSTHEGLKKDKVNVVYCYMQQCHLAPEACVEFAENGYSVCELEGGFDVWQRHGLPVQSLAAAGGR